MSFSETPDLQPLPGRRAAGNLRRGDAVIFAGQTGWTVDTARHISGPDQRTDIVLRRDIDGRLKWCDMLHPRQSIRVPDCEG